MLEKREFEKSDFKWRLSSSVAVVSGLFSVLLFLLMVINYLQIRAADPAGNEMLTQMRVEYASLPEKDEVLAKRIQDLDLLTRKALFTSQSSLRAGSLMLLAGVSIFLIAFKSMTRWRPSPPELDETPTAEREFLAYAESRTLIMWAGVALLGTGLAAALFTESELVSSAQVKTAAENGEDLSPAGAEQAEAEEPAPIKEFPKWETVRLNWPTFRGPGAFGLAHYKNAPTEWDVEAGTHIRWKVEVPKQGTNSPVVWENRLFISGADEKVREVYCYDTDTGALVWKRALESFSGTPAEAPQVSGETGLAAPTMAAHGDRVFAMFANGDLVSYDFEGDQVWGRNLGEPVNHYGHSSSLIAYEGLLYVQFDDSENAKVFAFDVATGKPSWEGKREFISWSSPILAHTPAGPQLILNNESNVDAYDPATGALIWSQECLAGEVGPSPAYSNGMVFVANEFAMATAIKLGGPGEEAKSDIAWQWDELLPEVSSPVGDGERFYFGTSVGDLVSLDAKTGEQVWVEEVDEGFYSSPVLVGDRIYILDMAGKMYIIRAGAEYELIASPSMGENTLATPAFMDGRIYVRTEEHLFCIESQDA